MKEWQAKEKIDRIQELAEEIKSDDELKSIDERYSVMAGWIDTDIENVGLD